MCDGLCGGCWCDPDCEHLPPEMVCGAESEEQYRLAEEEELIRELVKANIVFTAVPA